MSPKAPRKITNVRSDEAKKVVHEHFYAARPPRGGTALPEESPPRPEFLEELLDKIKEVIGRSDPDGTQRLFQYVDAVRFGQRPPLERFILNPARQPGLSGSTPDQASAFDEARAEVPTMPDHRLNPAEQSLFLMGMLMALDIDAGLHLAVHFYIAIVVGMTTDKIAHAILLGQIYTGLPAYTACIRTFSETLTVLANIDPAEGPGAVIDGLVKHFGLSY
jgi:alkylhydroperoxidase/carboxymuconolactone decarboxylase family protein YurZ